MILRILFCLCWLLFLFTACGPSTAPCTDVCKPSEAATCDGQGVRRCLKDLNSGCYVWTVTPCPSGQRCELGASASCTGGPKACENPTARKGCFEGAVYWYDECGDRRDLVEKCAESCEGGVCVVANPCPQDCTSGQTRCQGTQIQRCKETAPGCFGWEVAQLCPAGQQCTGSSCVPRTDCPQECKRADIQCFNNGLKICVEWKPGCFAWGPGKKCGPDESCQAGSCVPRGQCPDPPACTAGARDCQGNAVRQCSNDAQGCPAWKTLTTCGSGQSCQAGQCKSGCSNQCTEGQRRCSGNSVQICKKSTSGCLQWVTSNACSGGQTCQAGQCKAGCTNACKAGQQRCAQKGVQTCERAASGCTVWGNMAPCPGTEVCQSGQCKPPCAGACSIGARACNGNTPTVCQKDAKGCGAWVKQAACVSPQICSGGKCESPGSPGTRSQSAVCTRWKADYPEKSSPQWTGKGNCDPGTISEGSIQDALRRTNLYRWMVGLPPVPENKALRPKMQACAVLSAENTPFQGGFKNPHSPQPSVKCYTRDGASLAGSSNLSWGVGSPAQSVDQYMADRGVPSLGHRLWLLSPRLGSTAFGHASGAGRYRTASCQHVFDGGGRARPEYVAYPPPGFVPMGAMRMGRAVINDWSFTSAKHRVRSTTKVTLTRLSDNNVQTPKVRALSSRGGLYPGIAFVPRFPKAGESYKVQIGTFVTYTVKFVSCP